MSKLKKIKTFLLFGLIAIVSIVGFCIVGSENSKQSNMSVAEVEQGTTGAVGYDNTSNLSYYMESETKWYLIEDAEDLYAMQEVAYSNPDYLGCNYILCADIEISWGKWMDVFPIGYRDDGVMTPFTGVFNGNGKTITFSGNNQSNPVGMDWEYWNGKPERKYMYDYDDSGDALPFNNKTGPGVRGYGLFAWVKGDGTQTSRIRNLEVVCSGTVYFENWSQKGNGSYYKGTLAFGGIAGIVTSDATSTPVIEQCKIDMDVSIVVDYREAAWRYGVGGVAGFVHKAKISDCRVNIANISVDSKYDFNTNKDVETLRDNPLMFFLGGLAGVVQNAYLGTSLVISEVLPFDVKTLNNAVDTMYPLEKTIHMLYGFRNNRNGSCAYDNAVIRKGQGNFTSYEPSAFKFLVNETEKNLSDSEYYESNTGDYFFSSNKVYSSNVHTEWESDSSYVWWKLNGVDVCKDYPIQRAFLPIEEITFYNGVDDSHGVHSVKYNEKVGGKVEVIDGYSKCTWKWIYDQLGDSNLTHRGYVFNGGIITTMYGEDVTFTRNSTAVYTASYNQHDWLDYTGDQIWLKPQRHVSLAWTQLNGTLKISVAKPKTTACRGDDYTGWSSLIEIPIEGVFELKAGGSANKENTMYGITEQVNNWLVNNGYAQYCLDYLRYYSGSPAVGEDVVDSEAANGACRLAVKYDSANKQLVYSGIEYDEIGEDTDGWWLPSSRNRNLGTANVEDFYVTEEGSAIVMRAYLKYAPLKVRTYNFKLNSVGTLNEAVTIENSVHYSNLKWYASAADVEGCKLLGWSMSPQSFNKTHKGSTRGATYSKSEGEDLVIYSNTAPYSRVVCSLGNVSGTNGTAIVEIAGGASGMDPYGWPGGTGITSEGEIILYPIVQFEYQWYNPDELEGGYYKTITARSLGAPSVYMPGDEFPTVQKTTNGVTKRYSAFYIYNAAYAAADSSAKNGLSKNTTEVNGYSCREVAYSSKTWLAGETIDDDCEGYLYILPFRFDFIWLNPNSTTSTQYPDAGYSKYGYEEMDGTNNSWMDEEWTKNYPNIPLTYCVGETFPAITYGTKTYSKYIVTNDIEDSSVYEDLNYDMVLQCWFRKETPSKVYCAGEVIPEDFVEYLYILPIDADGSTVLINYYIPTLQYENGTYSLKPKCVKSVSTEGTKKGSGYTYQLLNPSNYLDTFGRSYYTFMNQGVASGKCWYVGNGGNILDYEHYKSYGYLYPSGVTSQGADPFAELSASSSITAREISTVAVYDAYLMLESWTEYTIEFWYGAESSNGEHIESADQKYTIFDIQGTRNVEKFAYVNGKVSLAWANALFVPQFKVFSYDEKTTYNSGYRASYDGQKKRAYTANGAEFVNLVTKFTRAGADATLGSNQFGLHIVVDLGDDYTQQVIFRYNYDGNNTSDDVDYFAINGYTMGKMLPTQKLMQEYLNGLYYTNTASTGEYYSVCSGPRTDRAKWVLAVQTNKHEKDSMIVRLDENEYTWDGSPIIVYLYISHIETATTFELYRYKHAESGELRSQKESARADKQFVLYDWKSYNDCQLTAWEVEKVKISSTLGEYQLSVLRSLCSGSFGDAIFLGVKNDQGIFELDDNGLIKFDTTGTKNWILSGKTITDTIQVYGVWGSRVILKNSDGTAFSDPNAPHWKDAISARASNGIYCKIKDGKVYSGGTTGNYGEYIYNASSDGAEGAIFYDINMPLMIEAGRWRCITDASDLIELFTASKIDGVEYRSFTGIYNGTKNGLVFLGKTKASYFKTLGTTIQLVSNVTYNFSGWTYKDANTGEAAANTVTNALPWNKAQMLINSGMSNSGRLEFAGWVLDGANNYNEAVTVAEYESQGKSGTITITGVSNAASKYQLTYTNGYITNITNIGVGSLVEVTIKYTEPNPEYNIIYVGSWDTIAINSKPLIYRKAGSAQNMYLTNSGSESTTFADCLTQTYVAQSEVKIWGYDLNNSQKIFSDNAGGSRKGGNIFKGWKIVAISENGSSWMVRGENGWDDLVTASSWQADNYIYTPYGMNGTTTSYTGKQYNVIMLAVFENTITLDLDGGKISTNYSEAQYDAATRQYKYLSTDSFALPARGYMQKTGKVFAGWVVSGASDGYSQAWTFSRDDAYLNPNSEQSLADGLYYITAIKSGSYGDWTLKAIWLDATPRTSYKITLQPNGATVSNLTTLLSGTSAIWQNGRAENGSNTYIITYYPEDVFNLPSTVTYRSTTYTSISWTVTSSTQTGSKTIISSVENDIFVANGWTVGNTYTKCDHQWGDVTLTINDNRFAEHIIKLNLNGGSIPSNGGLQNSPKLPYYDSSAREIHYAMANTFSLPTPTRAGYTFLRWRANGVYTKDGHCGDIGNWQANSYASSSISNKYGCVEVVALWRDNRISNTYTLTLDLNGGSLVDYAPSGLTVTPSETVAGIYTITYQWGYGFDLPTKAYKDGEEVVLTTNNWADGKYWKVIESSIQDKSLELENGWNGGKPGTLTAHGWMPNEYEPSLRYDATLVGQDSYYGQYDVYHRIGNVTLQLDWDAKMNSEKHYIQLDLNADGVKGTPSATVALGNPSREGSYYDADKLLICYENKDSVSIGATLAGYTLTGWKVARYSNVTPAGCGTIGNWGNVGDLVGSGTHTGKNGCVKLIAQWTPAEHLIKLSGGTISGYMAGSTTALPYYDSTNGIHYSIESTFNLPTPTKTGYKFDGWKVTGAYIGSEADRCANIGNWTQNAILAGGSAVSDKYGCVNLVAQWTAIKYTITFEYPTAYTGSAITITDGSVGATAVTETNKTAQVTYTYTSSGTLPECSTAGYRFVGWIIKGKAPYTEGGNGEFGLFKFKKSQDPQDTAHYYIAELRTNSCDNVTLTAVWEAISYEINLIIDANAQINGYMTGSSATQLPYYDTGSSKIHYNIESDFNLPNAEAQKAGYVLDYWKVITTGSEAWIKDATLSNVDNGLKVAGKYGTATLQAYWKVLGHNDVIKFDFNGGDSTVVSTVNADYNAPYVYYNVESKITLPNATRDGYTFKHWIVSGLDCGSLHKNAVCNCGLGSWTAGETLFGGNVIEGRYGCVTLTAVWTPTNYQILLAPNSGTIDPDFSLGNANDLPYYNNSRINYTIECSSQVVLPNVVRDGYAFDGWAITTEIAAPSNGWKIGKVESVGEGWFGNVTLQAQWVKNEYTITLSLNADDLKSAASYEYANTTLTLSGNQIKYYIDSQVSLPKAKCDGYTFGGWTLKNATIANKRNWTQDDINGCTEGSEHFAYATGKWGHIELEANWTKTEYSLSYAVVPSDATNLSYEGIGAYVYSEYNVTYDIDSQITILSELVAADYHNIRRWNVMSDGSESNWGGTQQVGSISGKYGNVILYVQNDIDPYWITLETAGGTLAGTYAEDISHLVYGVSGNNIGYLQSSSSNIPMPTAQYIQKEGYKFVGWTVNLGYLGLSKDGNTYTYTWQDGGNVTASIKCLMSGGYVSEFLTGSYGDVTLTANWEVVEHTIKLSISNSATIENYSLASADGTITYTKESTFNLPDHTNIKLPTTYTNGSSSAYKFTGWKVTGAYADGADECGGMGNWTEEGILAGGYTVSGKYGCVTLTAQWEIITHSIYLNTNGGSIENYQLNTAPTLAYYSGNTIFYGAHNSFALPTAVNTKRNGYTFAGWKVTGDYENGADKCKDMGNWTSLDGTTLDGGYTVSRKYGCVTLQAQWNMTPYQITLNTDSDTTITYSLGSGGENYPRYDGENKIIHYNIDSNFGLPINVVKTGYVFKGWEVAENSGNWTANTEFTQNTTTAITAGHYGNVILNPIWEQGEYTITFDMNKSNTTKSSPTLSYSNAQLQDDEDKIIYTYSYNVQTEIGLPDASNITCNGYKFEGWELKTAQNADTHNWTQADVEQYLGDTKTRGKFGDIYLLAKWSRITYTITYSTVSASTSNPSKEVIENNILEPSKFSKQYTIITEFPTDIELLSKLTGYEDITEWNVYGYYTATGTAGSYVLTETAQGNWSSPVAPTTDQPITGMYGNVVLWTKRQATNYTITLDVGTNRDISLNPGIEGYIGITNKGNGIYTIGYNIESGTVTLPIDAEVGSAGYLFKGWTFVFGDDGFVFDSESSTYTLTTAEGKIADIKAAMSGDYLTRVLSGSYGNFKLLANWEEIEYTILYAILDDDEEVNVYNITNNLIRVGTRVFTYQYTITSLIQLKTEASGYKDITEWTVFGYYKFALSSSLTKSVNGNWGASVKVPTGDQVLTGKYGDVVLYKQGNQSTYAITLDLGDTGEIKDYTPETPSILNTSVGETSIIYVLDKGSITLPISTQVSRNGRQFLGWQIQGTYDFADNVYTKDTTVKIMCEMTGSYITKILTGSFGNFILEAVWENNQYDITFSTGEGAVLDNYADNFTTDLPRLDNGKVVYTVENNVILPVASEMRAPNGYKFVGWVVSGDGYANDEQFNSKCKVTFAQVGGKYYITEINQGSYTDLTLTAYWTVAEFTINYEVVASVGGIDFAGGQSTYTINTTITLPSSSTVTANAYVLSGWKVKESVGNWVKDTVYSAGQELNEMYGSIDADGNETAVTLVACLDAIGFTITFEKGTHEDVELNENLTTINYTADDTFKFPAVDENGNIAEWQNSGATRQGYNLFGWKVKQAIGNWEADSLVWQVGTPSADISGKFGDVVLVPEWSLPIQYTLTIILDDGVVGRPKLNGTETSSYRIQYTGNDTISLPSKSALQLAGYTASHFEVDNGEESWTAARYELGASLKSMSGDATLKLIWGAEQHTIKLDGNGGQFSDEFINQIEQNGTFNGLNCEFAADKKSMTITYTIDDAFALPTGGNLTARGKSLAGWAFSADENYTSAANNLYEYTEVQGAYYITGIKSGNYESLVLYAQWTYNEYQITLLNNGGTDNGYSLNGGTADPQLKYDLTDDGGVITYTILSQFNLPNSTQLLRAGYTLRGWMVVEDTNGQTEYEQIIDKYNTASYDSTINYLLTQSKDGNYYIVGVNADSVGQATVIAIWEENQYELVFQQGNGSANVTKTLKYSEVACLDVVPSYANHVFIGWSAVKYSEPKYADIYVNTNRTYLSAEQPLNLQVAYAEWGIKILVANSYVQSLLLGGDPYDALPKYMINAVWLPEYTVTINANGGQVYNDGSLCNGKTSFTATNSYISGYTLSDTQFAEIFNPPTDSGYNLFRKGYSISGWVLRVGDKRYCVKAECQDATPSIGDWINGESKVASGINLQYLQGDIDATPIWEAMKFDVVFKTTGDEAYKIGYNKEYRTRNIQYGSKYFFYPETNVNVGNSILVIESTKIKGYSIDYIKPYDNNGDIQDITIAASGEWNYDNVTYVQNGSKWEVRVEGYYAPVLYRVKLNLNLPYSVNPTVNNNSFASGSATTLNATYEKLSLNVVDCTYTQTSEYTAYQNKLLIKDGEYYIYLLQDQSIYSKQNKNDDTAIKLPTFEIDSYEMQYYVLNGTEDKYSYVMVEDIKVEQPKNQPKNWKYAYCDENGVNGGSSFVFTIVWYRNVVNFEIQNTIEGQNSANGYLVVTETEQLTEALSGHKSTHIIIYAWDSSNTRYKYYHYEFDGAYSQPISTLLNYSAIELASRDITKTEANTITIYAGNKAQFSVYDQQLDHSLDEFVGYRFKQYSNHSSGAYSEVTELTTASDMLESNDRYTTEVDLGNYTEFVDKSVVAVNVEFANIKYVLRYFVGDADSNEVDEKYGAIAISYLQTQQEDADITLNSCIVDIGTQGIYPVQSVMKVNLGYELSRWVFIDTAGAQHKLGEAGEDATDSWYRLIISPEFLRSHIYQTTYSNGAVQTLGTMKAECQYIEFEIQVHVLDASTETELETYLADTASEQGITLMNSEPTRCAKVVLGNSYYIQFHPSKDEDGFVYYGYDGKQYAFRDFYLACSLRHHENALTTKFKYPTQDLSDIALIVNDGLLDTAINYTAGTAVLAENRYLHLYVNVAPKAEILFEVNTDSTDQNKGSRKLTVDGETVIEATSGFALQVVKSYSGYITQVVEIKLKASANYYGQAELTLPNGQITTISANGAIKFTIEAATSTIGLKLIPRTYKLSAFVEFDGTRYNFDDWQTVANKSGERIISNAEITPAKEFYYYGDKISLKFALTSADYICTAIASGRTVVTAQNANCVVTFNGGDLEIVLKIEKVSSKVTITTNLPNEDIGDIYIEINGTTRAYIQSLGASTALQQQFDLQADDKIKVYIKPTYEYLFSEEYEYTLHSGENGVTKITNGDTSRLTGYYFFDLFGDDNLYDSSMQGMYTLRFKPINTSINLICSVMGKTSSMSNFDASYTLADENGEDNSLSVREGIKVALSEGRVADGYRFENFTYREPNKNSSAIELPSEFVVDTEIVEYLSSIDAIIDEDGNAVRQWHIYVNFVEQYTVTVKFECDNNLVNTDVTLVKDNGVEISKRQYQIYNEDNTTTTAITYSGMDYNSVVLIDIAAIDFDHYSVNAKFDDVAVAYHPQLDAWIDNANRITQYYEVDRSVFKYTYNRNGNLSGFVIARVMDYDLVVTIKLYTEQFKTVLTEYYQTGINDTEIQQGATHEISSALDFNTKPSIKYSVAGSLYYGTKVRVNIYTSEPTNGAGEYYQLCSVKIAGREIQLDNATKVKIDGKTYYVYTIEYEINSSILGTAATIGSDPEAETDNIVKLDVTYKTMKKVQIEINANNQH